MNYEALFFDGVVAKKGEISTIPSYQISFTIKEDSLYEKYKLFLDAQVGKKYDFLAIFGFFGKRVEDPKRWYCSELSNLFFRFYFPDIDINKNISPKESFFRFEALREGLFNRHQMQ